MRAAPLRTLPRRTAALAQTRAHFDSVLANSVVVTPDVNVNRGVLWAKANMLRTQLCAPTGWCFVNDPTRTNNSVGRDTASFVLGSDYVTPDFSRESLRWYLRHARRSGKIVEYYDVRNGKPSDYGLNINDDTPLVVLALAHHYRVTGDIAFLRESYAAAKRAADYLLKQRDARGLVWCTATGTYERGIVGWRNIIDDYRISGASTEVNSECYGALVWMGAHGARARKEEGRRALRARGRCAAAGDQQTSARSANGTLLSQHRRRRPAAHERYRRHALSGDCSGWPITRRPRASSAA